MHDHGEILALAAAAIDFELDTAERQKLRIGLEECTLCRRQAAAMRATATILARPSDIGTPSRVRDVVIGAALRGDRRAPALRSLLLASLATLAVLGGTVFVAGNRGFGLFEAAPSPSIPIPTTVAQASPSAPPTPATVSPSPSPSPIVTPTPLEPMPPATIPPVDEGPLRAGEIATMVTDGRLVIRTKPGTGADSAIFKTKLHPGQRVLTLEGPVEGSGYSWYRVRLGDIEGWAAAAGLDGEPWLAPVRNGFIAFVRSAGDGVGEAIYSIGAGQTGESILFADPGLVQYEQLTWSPDGRMLAFVGTPAGGNGSTEIYTIAADGSSLVRITENDVDDDSPAWSPDGTRLALRVDQVDPSATGDSNVVVTPVVGPGVTVLGPGRNPVWSPDGLQIAMTVADGGSTHIWVQGADGDGRRQVAEVSVASIRPSWSPDGQSLVVSSSGLSIVEVTSGALRLLTAEPGSLPAWSIGGHIAFATTGSASPGIFVVDDDGSSLRRLTGDLGVVSTLSWSPDGRWLVLGDDVGAWPVTIVNRDAGGLTPLGTGGGPGWSPAWQPRLP